MSKKVDHKRLFFTGIGGAGTIICLDCTYEQKIVSFLHGVNWDNTGYQCQQCGRFHEIILGSEGSNKRCECGGKLSRDKPLFCPKCKSSNISYHLRVIT